MKEFEESQMKKLYPDDLAARIKESGETHYRPSNGTEGFMFMETFCGQCEQCHETEFGMDCYLITNAMLFGIEDSSYPTEWTYSEGQPTCTAFEDRNPKDERQKSFLEIV